MNLDPTAFDKVGPVPILVLVLLLLGTGVLVPGWLVRRQFAQLEKHIETLTKTNSELLEVGKTMDAVLESVKGFAAYRRRQDDEEDSSREASP